MMRTSCRLAAVAGVLGIGIFGTSVRAQVATFQVDESVSALTVSGTALGAPIQPQGPGSLTTTYYGPLLVQLAPGSIAFPGGSAVTANDSGNWQPAPGGLPGSAPANYGGRVVVLFTTSLAAVRDAIFDATTAQPFALSSTGTFSSDLTMTPINGTIDYSSPLAGSGSNTLVGDSAQNASPNAGGLQIVPAGGGFASATLTLPISFTLISDLQGLGEGVFHFNGSMAARATARGGDANFDGRVSLDDFNTLASHFGTSGGASWLSADFNFDGNVNLDDFNILAGNFGMTAAANGPTPEDWTSLGNAVVPEPASLALSPLATLLALRRRRRA